MEDEKKLTEEKEAEKIVQPKNALPEANWESLPDLLREFAKKAGWSSLMPVQALSIPYVLAKRDLMVQSKTGSGKTGAYLLPSLSLINPESRDAQVLIIVPTRELALQVVEEAEKMCRDTMLTAVAVYGGTGYHAQQQALEKGAQVLVGTPGRLLDFLMRGTLKLDKLKVLVLDEADRMLSLGFYPDMRQLLRFLPARYNGYLYSATFPTRVLNLAGQFLANPEFLSLSRDNVHVTEILHEYCSVPVMEKDRCLVRVLETENPESVIVFCNMKATVHYVTVVLKRFGFEVEELSADLPQKKREDLLRRVKEGKLKILVATDIAARGIDIQDLGMVIQYEPPEEQELYIHRAGRTGRAGAAGTAITLVSPAEKVKLVTIARTYHIDLKELKLPSEEEAAACISERLLTSLEQKSRALDLLQKERAARFEKLAKDLPVRENGEKLLALLLDRYYQDYLMAGDDNYVPKVAKEKNSGEHGGRSRRRRGH